MIYKLMKKFKDFNAVKLILQILEFLNLIKAKRI